MARSLLPDRFEIREIVGRGSLSTVYRALDLRYDREVAVKLVTGPKFMSVSERRAWAAAAAEAMQPHMRVWHPNLAFVRHAGQHDTSVYVVRDILPQNSADAWGCMTFAGAAAVAASLAGALDALAEKGLKHGAVHARNVFRDVDGRPRLTDAGVAAAAARMQVAGYRCRVPERGRPASDISALAALVYRLVTGEEPAWDGKALRREAALPPEAAFAIRRALRSRSGGYGSAASFAEALLPLTPRGLFQAVWQPAAAGAMLVCLGTIGGLASSEDGAVSAAPVPPAPIVAPAPPAPTVPALAARLSPHDQRTLRLWHKMHGPSCLLDRGVASVFGIRQQQSLVIEGILSQQRSAIDRLVQAVADGYCTDTAAPMSAIRQETARRVAEALEPEQRALWDWLSGAEAQQRPGL